MGLRWKRVVLVGLSAVVIVVLIAIGITRHIQSMMEGEMEDLLFGNDLVIVDPTAYWFDDPQRLDIICYPCPRHGNKTYVERIVGLPGDTVEIRRKVLFINGREFLEPATVKFCDTSDDGEQLMRPAEGAPDNRDDIGPIVVAPGLYFVLGDNRDWAVDSRWYGLVPRSLIIGKARWVVRPL